MEKLAIQGGSPVRTQKIFYGRQWVDEGDVKAVESVLVSDYLTCGPKVQEMERTLEKYTGAKHAVAVSNGTAALHCACIAAGVGPGDEVITTPIHLLPVPTARYIVVQHRCLRISILRHMQSILIV